MNINKRLLLLKTTSLPSFVPVTPFGPLFGSRKISNIIQDCTIPTREFP